MKGPERWWALLLMVGSVACKGKDARAPVGIDEDRVLARKSAGPELPVTGYMFADVGERSIGPFFARRGTGTAASGLVAWVTAAEGTGRRVIVVPIDARGAPHGGETVVANVSVDTLNVVVKPMRGPVPGFLITWTSLTDRGKSLWSVAVSDNGAARTKPVELTRTMDDIPWTDVIPTDHGAVCLWAEETRGGDANLIAVPLNTDGRVRGVPIRIAQGVIGWHALELPTGIGLSTVTPKAVDPNPRTGADHTLKGPRTGGALAFHRLDAEAHAAGPPIVITNQPIVSGDVEVTRQGSRLLFAWTDRSGEEPSITIAAIDESAKPPRVDPPRKLADARGGASLLALAGGSAGVAVMFDAPVRRKGERRYVHVARVGADLALERPALSLEMIGRGQPELAATSTGFAALATLADCDVDSPSCANAQPVATILRTDAKVGVLQREPLTFQTDPATLGWGMTCEDDTCFALAASPSEPGSPSRVRTAVVRPRVNAKVAPSPIQPPLKDGPHIADITAIATGESVVDLAATRMGESSLVAILSSKADAGGRAMAGHRGTGEGAKTAGVTLSTRLVTENGEATAPIVISGKALPVGGVAIAGADKPADGGAIAWVARDGGDPQVHVTRVDKSGRRMNDVQLTTAKGDASDVTITWAGGGWIVAWVDGRDGNGEVYATRVNTELTRVAREERITNAPGDASDLVALAHGTDVWLAWADPRESPKDGIADVFVSAVRMRDAKGVFDEQRVLATAGHSRTPYLAAGSSEVYLAWIEEAPMGSETPSASGYGAFFARLDSGGKAAERPARMPLAGDGAATSVVLEAKPNLRAVVARSSADAISLDAVDLAAAPPRASSLLSLDGPPSLDVALALESNVLYFNDEGPRIVDRRARRARIAWTASEKRTPTLPP